MSYDIDEQTEKPMHSVSSDSQRDSNGFFTLRVNAMENQCSGLETVSSDSQF